MAMFNYSYDIYCELSQNIINLLEKVDAFPFSKLSYSMGNSRYQSLGDIHKTLENVYVKDSAGERKHIVSMTILEIKKQIDEWKEKLKKINAHNNAIYVIH